MEWPHLAATALARSGRNSNGPMWPRIHNWWAQAYDGVLGERFRLEAQASLPLVGGSAGVEEVYAGVRVQRLRLRFDLGVGEWG